MQPSLIIIASTLLAAVAAAQSVVVPNASANLRGINGLNTLTRDAGNPRTYQMGIAASELAAIPPGSIINGISFRSNTSLSNPATWPPANNAWNDYEIHVGNAVPISTWTLTYATNFSGTPVMVRDGGLLIEPNTYTNNTGLPAPQPNAWGDFFFDFQSPFVYAGGDLAIQFSHPGSNTTTFFFFDVVATNNATVRAQSSTAFQSPAATATANFCIARIHYGYGSGCPGTGGQAPNLVQSNDITGGGAVTFAIGNGPASAAAAFLIGATSVNIPLPNGCLLLATPTVVVPVALNANGRIAFTATFPPGAALVAYLQAVVIDLGAPGLFTTTNGVTFTVNP